MLVVGFMLVVGLECKKNHETELSNPNRKVFLRIY